MVYSLTAVGDSVSLFFFVKICSALDPRAGWKAMKKYVAHTVMRGQRLYSRWNCFTLSGMKVILVYSA